MGDGKLASFQNSKTAEKSEDSLKKILMEMAPSTIAGEIEKARQKKLDRSGETDKIINDTVIPLTTAQGTVEKKLYKT
jgi:hypothetical protein